METNKLVFVVRLKNEEKDSGYQAQQICQCSSYDIGHTDGRSGGGIRYGSHGGLRSSGLGRPAFRTECCAFPELCTTTSANSHFAVLLVFEIFELLLGRTCCATA